MRAQQRVAAEIQAAKVGRVLQVIVDDVGELPGEMIGRSQADAPDVDGRVTLDTDGTVVIGDIVDGGGRRCGRLRPAGARAAHHPVAPERAALGRPRLLTQGPRPMRRRR
jgi:hypothetical protein